MAKKKKERWHTALKRVLPRKLYVTKEQIFIFDDMTFYVDIDSTQRYNQPHDFVLYYSPSINRYRTDSYHLFTLFFEANSHVMKEDFPYIRKYKALANIFFRRT